MMIRNEIVDTADSTRSLNILCLEIATDTPIMQGE